MSAALTACHCAGQGTCGHPRRRVSRGSRTTIRGGTAQRRDPSRCVSRGVISKTINSADIHILSVAFHRVASLAVSMATGLSVSSEMGSRCNCAAASFLGHLPAPLTFDAVKRHYRLKARLG
ncbi:hypothetical protein Bbelb_423930 [Branchiostoma belcheri]|nr:hypothetical protein Bbelb_423930 [Branchiostoma belcheri]